MRKKIAVIFIAIIFCQVQILHAQHVGINTMTPTSTFEVFDSNNVTELKVRNANSSRIIIDGASPNIDWNVTGVRKASIGWSSNAMKFYSSPPAPPFNITSPTLNLTEDRKVGINMGLVGNPTEALDVNGRIKVGNSTDPTVAAGTIRWNDETQDFEGYNGTEWLSLTPQSSKDWYNKDPLTAQSHDLASVFFANNRYAGYSVSIGDTYAFIGAYGEKVDSSFQGAVDVFKRSGDNWVYFDRLLSSQPREDAVFGVSVAQDGNYMVVGASSDDGPATNCGAAYVFYFNGIDWIEQAKLIANDADVDDRFGCSVGISGNRIVVGARSEDGGSGAIYTFNRSGTSWSQTAKLIPNDLGASDRFGWAVDIDGDYIVAGSRFHAESGLSQSGAGYIFCFNGTVWTQQDKLIRSDPTVLEWFGSSVAIDGDQVIVGSPGATTSINQVGVAYIFQRSGTTWPQQAQLRPSSSEQYGKFGSSVDIQGEYAVVGSEESDRAGIDAGIAFVFAKSGTTWNQQVQLYALNAQTGMNFGASVSLFGNHIAVGAPEYSFGSFLNRGRAYLFEK